MATSIDLPPARSSSRSPLYVRRTERSTLPLSCRGGLVFFAAVLLLSLAGITLFQANILGSSRQGQLDHRMTVAFDQIFAQLRQQAAGSRPLSVTGRFSELQKDPLVTAEQVFTKGPIGPTQPSSAQLVNWGALIEDGQTALLHLTKQWSEEAGQSPMERLRLLLPGVREARESWGSALEQAETELATPSAFWSVATDDSLDLLRDLHAFLGGIEEAVQFSLDFLTPGAPRRVAVFFQDSATVQATGGALSAGMELLLDGDGRLLSSSAFHLGDLDPSGQLLNSNSSLDFSRSADRLVQQWRRLARSSLDLVIFVNTSALGALLPQHALLEQRWSEHRAAGNREALKGMSDELVNQIVASFADFDSFLRNRELMRKLARSRHVLAYSPLPRFQDRLTGFGLTGVLPILQPGEDFLAVGHVNLDSQATDRWVSESRVLHTAIQEDGRVRHWLQIQRSHQGDQVARAQLAGSPALFRQRLLANRVLLRLLVPKGSRLLSSAGMVPADVSLDESGDFAVWSFVMETEAGTHSSVELIYEAPIILSLQDVDSYRLRLFKEPGGKEVLFEHRFALPDDISTFQELPEQPLRMLDQDEIIALVLGRNP
ncbi:MAG: hypothetical protein Q8P95_00865 [bacterium]|nr:hypothetical protein [bacterium]